MFKKLLILSFLPFFRVYFHDIYPIYHNRPFSPISALNVLFGHEARKIVPK